MKAICFRCCQGRPVSLRAPELSEEWGASLGFVLGLTEGEERGDGRSRTGWRGIGDDAGCSPAPLGSRGAKGTGRPWPVSMSLPAWWGFLPAAAGRLEVHPFPKGFADKHSRRDKLLHESCRLGGREAESCREIVQRARPPRHKSQDFPGSPL